MAELVEIDGLIANPIVNTIKKGTQFLDLGLRLQQPAYLETQSLRGPAQMGFQNLPNVHP